MKRYSVDYVYECVNELLVHYGLDPMQAREVADCFIVADSCGVHTHGLSVLTSHLDRIERGGYNLVDRSELIKSTAAFAVVDAKNTIGMLSAKYCMELAIEKCKEVGMYAVFSRNCNTYGPAFYYTKMATDHKVIGMTACNTPAAMPPTGSKEKLLGTNPFALGVPGLHEGPILFDMATSVVAKSKINEARKNNESIPEGWALDSEGNSTTDPIEAIKGAVLPMAGAKGYGLALSIDILAGVLSGAAYLDGVGRFYSQDNKGMNVGQVFIAIDPTIVLSEDFYQRIDEYIARIHSSVVHDEKNVRFPGEKKLMSWEETELQGLELSEHTVDSLNCYLKKCNINKGL